MTVADSVLYPLCKLVAGKVHQAKLALWMLTVLSLLFFSFYPYS